jgi:hypothetical protein
MDPTGAPVATGIGGHFYPWANSVAYDSRFNTGSYDPNFIPLIICAYATNTSLTDSNIALRNFNFLTGLWGSDYATTALTPVTPGEVVVCWWITSLPNDNVAVFFTSGSTSTSWHTQFTIWSSGLSSFTPDSGGAGAYVPGDILTPVQTIPTGLLSGGSGGLIEVTAVDGSGNPTNLRIVVPGQGFAVGTAVPTTGGSGTGATINIDAITGWSAPVLLPPDPATTTVTVADIYEVSGDGTNASYYYNIASGPPLAVGQSVTVTGCTTAGFNVTGTIIYVFNASASGYFKIANSTNLFETETGATATSTSVSASTDSGMQGMYVLCDPIGNVWVITADLFNNGASPIPNVYLYQVSGSTVAGPNNITFTFSSPLGILPSLVLLGANYGFGFARIANTGYIEIALAGYTYAIAHVGPLNLGFATAFGLALEAVESAYLSFGWAYPLGMTDPGPLGFYFVNEAGTAAQRYLKSNGTWQASPETLWSVGFPSGQSLFVLVNPNPWLGEYNLTLFNTNGDVIDMLIVPPPPSTPQMNPCD